MLATLGYKKVFIVSSLLLSVALFLVFALAPSIAERWMNVVVEHSASQYRKRLHACTNR